MNGFRLLTDRFAVLFVFNPIPFFLVVMLGMALLFSHFQAVAVASLCILMVNAVAVKKRKVMDVLTARMVLRLVFFLQGCRLFYEGWSVLRQVGELHSDALAMAQSLTATPHTLWFLGLLALNWACQWLLDSIKKIHTEMAAETP